MVGKKEYEIIKEGNDEILRVDANSWPYPPSIESNPLVMIKTIDYLSEFPSVIRLVFNQRKDFIYEEEQTRMLAEVARLYDHFTKQKKLLNLSEISDQNDFAFKYAEIRYIIFNLLRSDPIGAYVEANRIIRESKVRLKKLNNENSIISEKKYIYALEYIWDNLEKTEILNKVKNEIAGYKVGSRDFYNELFRPTIRPSFIKTRLMRNLPANSEFVEVYTVGGNTVSILKQEEDIKFLYHVVPTELKATEDEFELINLARTVLAEHRPKDEEFLEPERLRRTFYNIGKDLLLELAQNKGINLEYKRIKQLTKILVSYTIGFGLIEVLLEDPKVQDVVVNSPIGRTPIYIYHADYGECVTNIIPSMEDADGWATKLKLLSARPLDEANPILDTELIIPGAKARVAVISNPLNPYGLAFALRRHREKPWTLPLFVNNGMISSLGAGLMSFLIDGSRTLLIAGTRSSGKTSFLGSLLVEIMRKYRIIVVEDSVTGDSILLMRKAGKIERTTIGKLVDSLIEKYGRWYNLSEHEVLGNDEDIEVLSMNKKGKINFSKISKFIRHKVKKPIYKILTRTGKEIKVTGDHSLFGIGDKGEICEIKVNELKKGGFIATPRKIHIDNKERKYFNLLEYVGKIEKGYFQGDGVEDLFKRYYYEIKQLAIEHRHNRSLRALWRRRRFIPVKIVKDLVSLGCDIGSLKNTYFRTNLKASKFPVLIELDKDLLGFIGLWIADGCYDKSSVILSVVEEENRKVAYNLAKKYDFNVKMHSDKFSLMLNSSTLRVIMREIFDLKGNAYTKRISEWVYNLSNEQISYVLKGIFSGDGCVSDKEIVISLSSLGLLKDIQTLLLNYGIILRIGKLNNDKTYSTRISSLESWRLFKDKIGLFPKYKLERLGVLCSKDSTHDTTNIIPLKLKIKKYLCELSKNFNYNDYVNRDNNIGRKKLGGVLMQVTEEKNELLDNLNILVSSDLFFDQIKEIEIVKEFNDYVYDLSIPENESFICNNIVAHNTIELPSSALRELGYNIQQMKVSSALTVGGTEVSADEGIRTSLRLGDSSLIVGEVRSVEARALYEAMRIGSMANVVAGTIHGDSAYGVFDRVVNDLGVPKTSFKATDIIVITNPVKSADGLHRFRRVQGITEVRKHWVDDPLRENGFVDLMKYDTKKDLLEVSDELINGESEVLKKIAGSVKEWVGNWDAVWENILLRAKIKETLVNYSKKSLLFDLLEAPFVVKSNDMFHIISGKIRQETGGLDNKRIFFEWNEWLKREIKLRKL